MWQKQTEQTVFTEREPAATPILFVALGHIPSLLFAKLPSNVSAFVGSRVCSAFAYRSALKYIALLRTPAYWQNGRSNTCFVHVCKGLAT
jgi:hypothetical protein